MKSRRDWPSRRLGASEKEWGTGRSSTSEIVPYTHWRCPVVSPCWQLATISPRRTCPAIGCSPSRHKVNRRRCDRHASGAMVEARGNVRFPPETLGAHHSRLSPRHGIVAMALTANCKTGGAGCEGSRRSEEHTSELQS